MLWLSQFHFSSFTRSVQVGELFLHRKHNGGELSFPSVETYVIIAVYTCMLYPYLVYSIEMLGNTLKQEWYYAKNGVICVNLVIGAPEL